MLFFYNQENEKNSRRNVGEEICWLSFPFLDPPSPTPVPLFSMFSVFPLKSLQCWRAPLLTLLSPLAWALFSQHTSSPRKLARCRQSLRLDRIYSRLEPQLPEPVLAKCCRLALPTWPDQARDAAPVCTGTRRQQDRQHRKPVLEIPTDPNKHW